MSDDKNSVLFSNKKILITAICTLFIGALLLWEHFHGGVAKHHILNRKDLPEISNWLGLLLIPILTWLLLNRIEKRYISKEISNQFVDSQYNKIFKLFLLGAFFGILLAVSFINDYHFILDNILYIFLGLSIFIPIYYSEFILGFILAMSYTFGAILPTAFIVVIAAIGYLIYRFLRPILLKIPTIFGK